MIEFYAYHVTVDGITLYYHPPCLTDKEINPRAISEAEKTFSKARLDEIVQGTICNYCREEISLRGLKESLESVKKYRNMPWVEYGMEIELEGRRGIIRGGNSSANFDVEFPGDDWLHNVHPWWQTVYYKDGKIIADYKELG